MPISYPLEIPVPYRSFSLNYEVVVGVNVSPTNLRPKLYEQDGSAWTLSLSFPPVSDVMAQAVNARLLQWFYVALNGPIGTFRFGDPRLATPRGIASGAPVVHAYSPIKDLINSRGWTPNTVGILLKGDRIQIGDHYYMITKDVNSDGGGYALLDILPKLRRVYLDGEGIVTINPKGIFRLSTKGAGWSGGSDGSYQHDTLTAIEAIPTS